MTTHKPEQGRPESAAQPPRHLETRERIRGAVKHVILPTITAAFETYPELDVAEILQLCAPALEEALRRELNLMPPGPSRAASGRDP